VAFDLHIRSRLAALVMLLSVATAAGAQQPDSSRAAADSAQRLTAVVVSGTRLSGASHERAAARTSVLDLRFPDPGPSGIATALTRLPGVSMSNDQGTRAQPTLDVRGFSLSPVAGVPQGVSVFLDGVRMNEPDAQELGFDLIPMDVVETASLTRGPGALFGKNSLAGALNLSTARGSATPRLEGGFDVGSFGYREARLIAAGARAGIDGLLLVKGSDENGYQAQSGGTTRQLFATLGRKRESSDAAFSVLLARDRLYEAGSLPASWIGPARRANYTGGDFYHPELAQATLRGSRRIGTAELRGNIFGRRNAIEQFNVNVADPDNRAFTTNRSLGATGEIDAPTKVGSRPLTVTAGAEYTHSRVDYRVLAEPNAVAPDLPADCDAASHVCEDARVNGDDAAIFAQLALQATSSLSLQLAARGDLVRIPFDDLREPDNSGTNSYRRLSPKLGATWRRGDAVRAYASAGSGFRAPAPLELACASANAPCPLPFSLGADPPLAPVTAWNYEVGGDWTPVRGTTLGISAFRTDVHDEIAFVSSGSASGYFQNVKRTRRDGLEATASVALPRRVHVAASYTALDATYESAGLLESALDSNAVMPGDRLALVPRQRATASIESSWLTGASVLQAVLSARAVSSQILRGDEANRMPPLPGYAVADLHLALERQHFAFSLGVDNLLDRRYAVYGVYGENPKGAYGSAPPATAPVERFYTPGWPRSLTFGVTVRR
jgi:iron complex outermembrane receptor protein